MGKQISKNIPRILLTLFTVAILISNVGAASAFRNDFASDSDKEKDGSQPIDFNYEDSLKDLSDGSFFSDLVKKIKPENNTEENKTREKDHDERDHDNGGFERDHDNGGFFGGNCNGPGCGGPGCGVPPMMYGGPMPGPMPMYGNEPPMMGNEPLTTAPEPVCKPKIGSHKSHKGKCHSKAKASCKHKHKNKPKKHSKKHKDC